MKHADCTPGTRVLMRSMSTHHPDRMAIIVRRLRAPSVLVRTNYDGVERTVTCGRLRLMEDE
jgi:hypothetical protein